MSGFAPVAIDDLKVEILPRDSRVYVTGDNGKSERDVGADLLTYVEEYTSGCAKSRITRDVRELIDQLAKAKDQVHDLTQGLLGEVKDGQQLRGDIARTIERNESLARHAAELHSEKEQAERTIKALTIVPADTLRRVAATIRENVRQAEKAMAEDPAFAVLVELAYPGAEARMIEAAQQIERLASTVEEVLAR